MNANEEKARRVARKLLEHINANPSFHFGSAWEDSITSVLLWEFGAEAAPTPQRDLGALPYERCQDCGEIPEECDCGMSTHDGESGPDEAASRPADSPAPPPLSLAKYGDLHDDIARFKAAARQEEPPAAAPAKLDDPETWRGIEETYKDSPAPVSPQLNYQQLNYRHLPTCIFGTQNTGMCNCGRFEEEAKLRNYEQACKNVDVLSKQLAESKVPAPVSEAEEASNCRDVMATKAMLPNEKRLFEQGWLARARQSQAVNKY